MNLINLFSLVAASLLLVNCSLLPQTAATTPAANAAPAATENKPVENANETTIVNANATQTTTAPDVLVKDLYKRHDAGSGPFFQKKSRAKIDKYFAQKLADLIWKDATEPTSETGAISFDPLFDAQDADPKNFAVGAPAIVGDRATVIASFVNFGAKEKITYRFVRENSVWKIADIEYKDGRSLVKSYQESFNRTEVSQKSDPPTADDAEIGNFEGTYQVGPTTCKVRPVRMAYELKWEKGSDLMVFYADGENRFVSQDARAGQDVFIFSDDSLSAGQFIRADGKEMTVRRIK